MKIRHQKSQKYLILINICLSALVVSCSESKKVESTPQNNCPSDFTTSYKDLKSDAAQESSLADIGENDYTRFQEELDRYESLKQTIQNLMKQKSCILDSTLIFPSIDPKLTSLLNEVDKKIPIYSASVRYAKSLDELKNSAKIIFLPPSSVENFETEDFERSYFVSSLPLLSSDLVKTKLSEFETELREIEADVPSFLDTSQGAYLTTYLERSTKLRTLLENFPNLSSENFLEFYHHYETVGLRTEEKEKKSKIAEICAALDIQNPNSAGVHVQIRSAYRRRARRIHPDRNSDPAAIEEFYKLSTLYREYTRIYGDNPAPEVL